jgi:hypothetical protein
MDIKNFLNKILNDQKGKNIPHKILKSFKNQFDNPLNIEWTKTGETFEAIFYKDELEHIAHFKDNGELASLKINLPLEAVPEMILNTAKGNGELMNAIAIHKSGTVTYELIVRDENLIRYFMLLSATGEVIEKEKL